MNIPFCNELDKLEDLLYDRSDVIKFDYYPLTKVSDNKWILDYDANFFIPNPDEYGEAYRVAIFDENFHELDPDQYYFNYVTSELVLKNTNFENLFITCYAFIKKEEENKTYLFDDNGIYVEGDIISIGGFDYYLPGVKIYSKFDLNLSNLTPDRNGDIYLYTLDQVGLYSSSDFLFMVGESNCLSSDTDEHFCNYEYRLVDISFDIWKVDRDLDKNDLIIFDRKLIHQSDVINYINKYKVYPSQKIVNRLSQSFGFQSYIRYFSDVISHDSGRLFIEGKFCKRDFGDKIKIYLSFPNKLFWFDVQDNNDYIMNLFVDDNFISISWKTPFETCYCQYKYYVQILLKPGVHLSRIKEVVWL